MAGMLGPHNFIELGLMKNGTKPCAYFCFQVWESPDLYFPPEFNEMVGRGELSKLEYHSEITNSRMIFFTQIGEEWRAKLFYKLNMEIGEQVPEPKITMEELGKIEGLLLGYSKEDIEFFLEHNRKQ